MVRNRVWLPLACAAALFTACNKGDGGSGGGGNPLTGGAPSAPTLTALDFIPKDAALVVGINWSKFKGTKYFNLLTANLPPDAKGKLDQMKQACSIDPLNDLESIVVGVTGALDKSSKAVFVVKGNWNEDKISKCATAMGDKEGKKVTVTKDGNLTTFAPANDKPATVGWAGDLLVATSTSADADKTFITEVMKHASPVKDNKAFMDLLGKTDQGGTIYGAFVPPPGSDATTAFNKVTGGNEKLAGAYGTIKLASDLDTNIGLRFGTDADAKTVADKMTSELENAKKSPQGALLSNTSITASGSDTVVALKLDEKQLEQITEQVKAFLPMMMGGMLGGMGGGQ